MSTRPMNPRAARPAHTLKLPQHPFRAIDGGARAADEPIEPVADRSIGEWLRDLRHLDDAQIDRIVRYQHQHSLRFGEAAITLKLASGNDVLWALSQQFQYPYPTEGAALDLSSELVAAIDPFSDQAETFRDIRSQLLAGVMAAELPPCALAVMSPDVGDGKTFFVANLAVAFSQLGARTLVVDADMRTPRLHQIFGVPNGSGLSDILAGRAQAEVIHRMPALPSLCVLPVGTVPPNPLELLQRPAFGLLLEELHGQFEHILIDTPAAWHGADARVVAARSGAALLIGRRGSSRMDAMQGLVDHVHKSRARLAGVTINEH